MKLKNIAIYFPKSLSYYEQGKYLLDKDGKKTDIKVEEISVLFGKIKVKMSNGDVYRYFGVSYSTKK